MNTPTTAYTPANRIIAGPVMAYLVAMLFWAIITVGTGLLLGLLFLERPVNFPKPLFSLTVTEKAALPAQPAPKPEPVVTVLQSCEQRIAALLKKQSIHFATGSARITETGMTVIDNIVPILAECQDSRLIITGHTDNTGSAQRNQTLSLQRAEAVANAIRSKGLTRFHFQVLGFGETQPIATNDTPVGRYQNRRIEMRLQAIAGNNNDPKTE